MSVEISVPWLALLISALAALYARWSAGEAKRANDIGRLNALLALRIHYIALIEHQAKLGDLLGSSPSGLAAVHKVHAELDKKLREVGLEIDRYHDRLVSSA